jgi:hypothetical protein
MIVVDIALAMICFLQGAEQVCHNALVGPATPTGEFRLVQRLTNSPGYGGDVLQFKEEENHVYAIHRVWTLSPKERRLQRLASPDARQRRSITNGCINVAPEVYEKLVSCCVDHLLVVR